MDDFTPTDRHVQELLRGVREWVLTSQARELMPEPEYRVELWKNLR